MKIEEDLRSIDMFIKQTSILYQNDVVRPNRDSEYIAFNSNVGYGKNIHSAAAEKMFEIQWYNSQNKSRPTPS